MKKDFGFSDKEKASLADDILSLYLDKNFGNSPKQEIDLVVFHHYLKHCKTANKSLSDLGMGKELGITPVRVRNMKLKDYLHQEEDPNWSWKAELLKQINESTFEIEGKDIIFVIRDIAIMTELRGFLEDNGLVNEYSLNPNLFRCSAEVMFKIWSILSDKEPNFVSKSLVDFINENTKISGNKVSGRKKISDLVELITPELAAMFPKAFPAVNAVRKIWRFCRS